MVSRCFIIVLLGAFMAGTTTALDAYATAILNGVNSVPLIDTPTTASFMYVFNFSEFVNSFTFF
jgi:hypothetical protein